MKKYLMTLALGAIASGAWAQYQVQNSGFEEWESVAYNKITGEEPIHWNSFITGTGGLKSTACKESQLEKSEDTRPGSKGTYSAKISDKNVTIAVAQGNMTTGCINMGSTTPSNAGKSAAANIAGREKESIFRNQTGNYNYTETSKDDFNQKFTGLPDAMYVWVKFVSTNSAFKAKATTVLHTAGYYQDPEPNAKDCEGKVVASATNVNIEANYTLNNGWQDLTIPFDYKMTDGTKPAYALVSFSTNATPGKGTGNDYMLIDDLEYLYYHALSDLKYDGKTITGFEEETTSYDLSNQFYDASKITFTKKGIGASVEQNYNNQTGVLTITVKGNDFAENPSSITTYTIQFKHIISTTNYTNALSVNVNNECSAPQPTNYTLTEWSDGSASLTLKNFMLAAEDYVMPVGNIQLDDVTVNGSSYTTSQTIQIEAGDDPSYEENDWYGPMLGDVPVELNGTLTDGHFDATIDINMVALGQIIKVVLAPELNLTTSSTVSVPSKTLKNVAFTRTFKSGWNTLILPFATTAEQLGAEEVDQLSSLSTDHNWVNFETVESGELEANKPYLVKYADAQEVNLYYGGEVTTAGDLSTTASATSGNGQVSYVGNYVASMDMNGKYGLYKDQIVQGGTNALLPSTACYFDFKNVANPAALSVKFGNGETTSISTITAPAAAKAAGVYNIQGIKLNSTGSTAGLPAGLYIVNGQKVLVK